jgi:ketosteroid isomerase-like protein
MKTSSFSILMAATAAPVQTSNVETVQSIYECFGRGDVPGILAKLSDEVAWVHGADPAFVPYGGRRRGIAGATEFFQKLGQNTQINVFQPSNFRTEGNKVLNEVHVEGTALSTGKTWIENSLFIWQFDANGKVAGWEASGNFSEMESAFR